MVTNSLNARKSSFGFTLIELMIVVAIIGVLASIALPKFADMVRRSKEASTKGQLGAIRSAITVYYGENEGMYPSMLESLTYGGKYLDKIPTAWTIEFGDQNIVTNGP